MIPYTTQDKLGLYGARWGCYATCLINIIENEKGRALHEEEILSCIGAFFVGEHVRLANYKDHKDTENSPLGWGANDDPEVHFFIVNQRRALLDLANVFHIPALKQQYNILKLSTPYGTHFVLQLDSGHIINPDDSITGEIVQKRSVSL